MNGFEGNTDERLWQGMTVLFGAVCEAVLVQIQYCCW